MTWIDSGDRGHASPGSPVHMAPERDVVPKFACRWAMVPRPQLQRQALLGVRKVHHGPRAGAMASTGPLAGAAVKRCCRHQWSEFG